MNEVVKILCAVVVAVLAAVIIIAIARPTVDFSRFGTPQTAEDEKPDVYIIANETEIEKDDTVQFELGGDKGDLPITVEWDFGDGSELSYKKNPKHKYKEKGKFEVKLIVTDEDGDIDTEEKNIVVNDPDATESNGDTSGGSNRIPVYNPYYFIFAFLTLMAFSMILIKKRLS